MNNEKKIINILSLSSEERYEYFIRKTVDFEQIWGLYNNGWATSEFNGGHVIPFWPEETFAELCATNEWAHYHPKAISLNDFIERWITGMQTDGHGALIFPTPHGQGVSVPLSKLKIDLLQEKEQYE